MTSENILLVLAQIELGLAGFVGLISTFRKPQELKPNEKIGIKMIMESALCLLIFSIIPFLTISSSIVGLQIWSISSIFLAIILTIRIIYQCLRLKNRALRPTYRKAMIIIQIPTTIIITSFIYMN